MDQFEKADGGPATVTPLAAAREADRHRESG
jgi:hypothetical protein